MDSTGWSDDKKQGLAKSTGWSLTTFISDPGFCKLVFSSKLETAKKFRDWVPSKVLPSIRKYGQYKLFGNPNNQMFKIEIKMSLICIPKLCNLSGAFIQRL